MSSGKALRKIEESHFSGNALLVYADECTFEIIGGILTDGIMVDEALDLLDIDMDDYAEERHWDGWDYDALDIVYTD